MYSNNDIILILNIIKITNKRIIDFIDDGNITFFQSLDSSNISKIFKFNFLNDLEIIKISENFLDINLDKIKYRLDMFSIKYVTILDRNYPERLKEIYNPPSILFYKGNLSILDNSIAIVGSRKASSYGVWVTKKLIKELSVANLGIISGMALGIDRIAHEAAIENGMKTIGVLASSIDIQYPKSNIDLYSKMNNQLLISESCLDVYPLRLNFVMRNRIISGLSLGVLVTEAGDKSGSLITANYAVEQCREVFAVPGQVNSQYSIGTNDLIKKGAKLVTCGKDILEEFSFLEEIFKEKDIAKDLNLSKESIEILNELKNGSKSVNVLANMCGINIEDIYSLLIKLEMKGLINRVDNNEYCLKI